MHFQAYVYIIFVYRFVYVDMSTRSSQINHLSLESITAGTYDRLLILFLVFADLNR